jgi:branched-chain amino acid transport system permease protein
MAARLERFDLQRAVKAGLIAGVVPIYCAVVGIIERFSERTIIDGLLNLGGVLFLVPVLVVGYLAARPRAGPGEEAPERGTYSGVLQGVVAGAIAGGLFWVLVLIANNIDLRLVLVSVTGALLEDITYGGSVGSAALYMIGGGAVLALAGGALTLLGDAYRKALEMALVLTLLLSLVEPLIRSMMREAGLEYTWLYTGGGLSFGGAIVVFVATAVLNFLWKQQGDTFKRRSRELPRGQQQGAKLVVFAVALVGLVLLPTILTSFLAEVIGTIGLYIVLGLGLNIVVGYAGLLDLGYVAFLAAGSYATAVLISPRASADLAFAYWLAVPLIIIIGTIVGIMIGAPVLRLRGDYLAIVTLGFGEIVRIIFLSELFRIDFRRPQNLYYIILITVIIVAFISARLSSSRVGRAWNAMREDEQVAEAMGISIIGYKLLAFATGAALGAISGIFFAIKLGSVFAHSFNIIVSINVLALIILGGIGSIPGVIAGAFVLVGLPELLREFAEFRLLIYGAILVSLMLLKPEGLLPSRRRQRELHIEEETQVQFEKRAGEEGGEPVVAT